MEEERLLEGNLKKKKKGKKRGEERGVCSVTFTAAQSGDLKEDNSSRPPLASIGCEPGRVREGRGRGGGGGGGEQVLLTCKNQQCYQAG